MTRPSLHRRSDMAHMQSPAISPNTRSWIILALALLPAIAVLYGALFGYRLLDRFLLPQSLMLGKVAAACLGVQLFFALAFWRRLGKSALALGGVAFWALAFVYYAGPQAAFSTVVAVCAALSVVSLIPSAAQSNLALRLLLGLAVLVGAMGWLLPFPIHDARYYYPLLLLLLMWRRSHLRNAGVELCASWKRLVGEQPLGVAATVFIAGFASLGLWLPSINYDDQSAHLIMQNQMLRDGYYHLDIFGQAWAVSPWFNNAFHALTALIAGESSRAAANLIWLLLGLSGAFRLARALGASTAGSLMATAIYATHPLTAYFGTTLQVDGVVAAVMMHMLVYLVEEHGRFRAGWQFGAMVGMLLALKITNVFYLLGPCIYFAWMAFRHRQWRGFLLAVLTAILVGGSNYAYAWLMTGNPVFPMLNTYFQSPYFPLTEFADPRWHAGLHVDTLWKLTFETGTYGEVWPGGAGVAMLGLAGGVVVALLRNGPARWVVASALLGGLLLFAQVQYLRYIFPAVAVACVAAVASLDASTRQRTVLALLTLALCAINLFLMPSTYWVLSSGAWNGLVDNGRTHKDTIILDVAPQQAILASLMQRSPNACVLLADPQAPFVGTMPGNALAIEWYDWQMSRAREWSNKDASGARWAKTLEALGVSRVLLTKGSNPSLEAALRQLGATVEDRRYALEMWSMEGPAHSACNRDFIDSRDRAHRLLHPRDVH